MKPKMSDAEATASVFGHLSAGSKLIQADRNRSSPIHSGRRTKPSSQAKEQVREQVSKSGRSDANERLSGLGKNKDKAKYPTSEEETAEAPVSKMNSFVKAQRPVVGMLKRSHKGRFQ